jgi:hypothetical protein
MTRGPERRDDADAQVRNLGAVADDLVKRAATAPPAGRP